MPIQFAIIRIVTARPVYFLACVKRMIGTHAGRKSVIRMGEEYISDSRPLLQHILPHLPRR